MAGGENSVPRRGDNFPIMHWEFVWSRSMKAGDCRPWGWNARLGLNFEGWGLAGNSVPMQGQATSSGQWSASRRELCHHCPAFSLPASGTCFRWWSWKMWCCIPEPLRGRDLPWELPDSPHALCEQDDKPSRGKQLTFLGFVCYCNKLTNAYFRCLEAKHHHHTSLKDPGTCPTSLKDPGTRWSFLFYCPTPTHSPLNILSTHQINQRIKAGMISGLSSWIPSFYLSSHCKPKAGQIRVLVSWIGWAFGCALFSTAQPIVQLMFYPIDVPMRLPVARRHSLAISTAASILWGFVTTAGNILLSNVAYL